MTRVTVFPAAREEGQAVNMARCTCPATQQSQKEREQDRKIEDKTEREVELGKMKG